MTSTASPESATAASSMPSFSQPTSWIPLTTTFTPPATCSSHYLSMLSSPGFFIWANEPVPVPQTTISDCYPSEFLISYTSVSSYINGTQTISASSVVPAMSPLVCPDSWNTVFTTGSYIACCPSAYKGLALPTSAIDSNRPAYGGTCYSDFSLSSSYPVTAYNNASVTGTITFVASTTPAQAYGHPIDGWALHLAAANTGISISTSTGTTASTTSAASSLASSNSSPSLSGGAIAGIAIGAALAAIFLCAGGLYVLCWRPRQRRRREPPPEQQIKELDSAHLSEAQHTNSPDSVQKYPAEIQANEFLSELPVPVSHYELPGDGQDFRHGNDGDKSY